ncbi:MAG TPA: protein-L-isoaspartate O-methyltransferase [Gammaproteobacteria bacterium]|nr:protein-L-isoaspartate O-methyltransferase [Gammaproteobacteria bacterium]
MNALNLEEARFNMIEQQIRTWDVLDDQVLETLANMPREDFVPERYRALAFSDISVPLAHEQVMMPPKLEGRLLQSLLLKPTGSVLEIGTGSGYLTACLAKLAGSVHSVDIFADFIEEAGSKLEKHGINNATFENIDAATGLDTPQRYDAIAVTGSLPVLHHGYHELLNPGGRLFVIVGKPPIMQALLITRSSDQEWREESLFEISIPPLINAPQPEAFRF